ncbi:uncharacterized protein [Periplaneta americana]|uniref:uncharacterized protein n=1 Tax=Periplaneta americana TaxID=6978 RepID=UPI0037E84C63
MEREIDPLAIGRSNTTDIEEGNSLSQERNILDHHVTAIKVEYEDHSQVLSSEITFEEDPLPISFLLVKREPEELRFLYHHVTGIKEEYVDQSHDPLSEVKFEEDPVPDSFPVVKHEPEEEQSDLHKLNEEPTVEVKAEDEIFIDRRVSCPTLQCILACYQYDMYLYVLTCRLIYSNIYFYC